MTWQTRFKWVCLIGSFAIFFSSGLLGCGEPKDKIDRILEREKQQKEIAAKLKEDSIVIAATLLERRKKFGYDGRNVFLDIGLDVQISVRGYNYDTLRLTYVLFSDVWRRKFETTGLAQKFKAMGFRQVELRDGYDYRSHLYHN